jgi:hypothetical protein
MINTRIACWGLLALTGDSFCSNTVNSFFFLSLCMVSSNKVRQKIGPNQSRVADEVDEDIRYKRKKQ